MRDEVSGRKIEAAGETWLVRMDEHEPHPGVRAIVFNCLSHRQRPWHVVEVAALELENCAVEDLEEERLLALFERAQPMDYAHGGEEHDPQQLSFDRSMPPTEPREQRS